MVLTVIPSLGGAILDTDIEKHLGNISGTQIVSGLTPSIGSGLTVAVASGIAIIEGHYVNDGSGSTVTVSASTTSSIWLQMLRNASGYVTSAQYTVAASQPADSAYICDFTSGASTVSSVTDKRAYNVATISFGNVYTLKIDGSSLLGIFLSGVEKLFFDSGGSLSTGQPHKFTGTQTTLTGTTAGSLIWSMPWQGSSYKKFIGFLSGYQNNTVTAQTITFPTAFVNPPSVVVVNSGSNGSPSFAATATATVLTLPTSMASAVTGWIICEGY